MNRKLLLDWYRRQRRDLPWRRTRDPYRVWISEVMLQQTTVRTVLPYYQAFLGKFPTVGALARASEEEVLAAWSGLGYYHRARNLRRAAACLIERHGGGFPRTLEAALAVPGVGPYTASAVLSIAYGMPMPVVDGNVRRVMTRFFALRSRASTRQDVLHRRADELLDRNAPGDWNQALMELGATVCRPRRPACPICPLRRNCRARRLGLAEKLPERAARRTPVKVSVAAALVEKAGRVLLVRRGEGRLMPLLWEVPQTSLGSRGLVDLVREIKERHGLEVEPGPLAIRARHAITFRRILVDGYRSRLRRMPASDPGRFLWARLDQIRSLPVSSMTRKLVAALADAPRRLPLS